MASQREIKFDDEATLTLFFFNKEKLTLREREKKKFVLPEFNHRNPWRLFFVLCG